MANMTIKDQEASILQALSELQNGVPDEETDSLMAKAIQERSSFLSNFYNYLFSKTEEVSKEKSEPILPDPIVPDQNVMLQFMEAARPIGYLKAGDAFKAEEATELQAQRMRDAAPAQMDMSPEVEEPIVVETATSEGLMSRPDATSVRPKLRPGSYVPQIKLNIPDDVQKDTAFMKEVDRVSNNLNVSKEDLLRVIQFETAGSWSPSQPAGTSSAVGLIQFMPDTAKGLGTTSDKLAKMTRAEQMKYVEKHLSMFLKDEDKQYDFSDLYMAVHWPAAVGKDLDYVMYEEGSKFYKANKPLDINKDGKVTKGEAVSKAAG